MSEFFYVIKVALASALLIAFLQVHVGDDTLESHVEGFIRTSSVGVFVSDAAQGLVEFSRVSFRKLKKWTADNASSSHEVAKARPGARDPIPKAFKREKAPDQD